MNRPFVIVVLLILVLAGFVLWPQQGINTKATAAKADISTFQTALGNFHTDCDRFPTPAEGLAALIKRPPSIPDSKWRGPYLGADKLPNDPWGFNYVYRCPGHHNPTGFDVFSVGPDGAADTADDLGNWAPPVNP